MWVIFTKKPTTYKKPLSHSNSTKEIYSNNNMERYLKIKQSQIMAQKKSGKNQNSLHYKYNKFLVSPYRPRGYNYYLTSDLPKNSKNNLEFGESKENGLDDSLGETEIYYPKPNNYNSIYTQKFSKKFKKYTIVIPII